MPNITIGGKTLEVPQHELDALQKKYLSPPPRGGWRMREEASKREYVISSIMLNQTAEGKPMMGALTWAAESGPHGSGPSWDHADCGPFVIWWDPTIP